jgi:hypothetical protein
MGRPSPGSTWFPNAPAVNRLGPRSRAPLLAPGLGAECPSRHLDDFDARAVVAFQQLEQLPGDGPLQAPTDISDALALGSAPDGVGPGSWVIAQPGQHDRVQSAVQLAVARAVQPMPGHLPGGGRDRVTPVLPTPPGSARPAESSPLSAPPTPSTSASPPPRRSPQPYARSASAPPSSRPGLRGPRSSRPAGPASPRTGRQCTRLVVLGEDPVAEPHEDPGRPTHHGVARASGAALAVDPAGTTTAARSSSLSTGLGRPQEE